MLVSWPRPRQGGWVGAARRQVAEGGAGAEGKCSRGPSTVRLLLHARSSAALCADVRARAVRGKVSVLWRAMNVRGAVSQLAGCLRLCAHLRLLLGALVKTRGMPLGRSLETSSE